MNEKNNKYISLLLIFTIGLLLRIAWLVYVRPIPVSDFNTYRNLAENLLNTHQFGITNPSAYRMPGNVVFLAICMGLSKSNLWLSLVNVFLDMIVCIELLTLTKRLFGQKPALLSFLIYAINPVFVCFSVVLASEHLCMSMLLGSIILALSGNRYRYLRAIVSGLFLGGAVLTRGDALFYVPLIGLIWLRYASTDKKEKTGWQWKPAVITLVITTGMLSPWYIRNKINVGPGAGLGTSGGMNFYFAHNSTSYGFQEIASTPLKGLNEAEGQIQGYRLGFQYLKYKPWSILKSIGLGTIHLYLEPPFYAIKWSVRIHKDYDTTGVKTSSDISDDLIERIIVGKYRKWQIKLLPGLGIILFLLLMFHGLLLLGLPLIFFTKASWTPRSKFIVGGFIFCNWFCYTVVFWAQPRYGFVTHVFLCMIAGIVLNHLVLKRKTDSLAI